MILRHCTKLLVAHHTTEDFLIPFHPLDEKIVKNAAEESREIGDAVRLRGFHHFVVAFGGGGNLVEEQLISLGKVCPESFVQSIDKHGKRDLRFRLPPGPDIGRSFQRLRLAVQQRDRALFDLLQPKKLQCHIVIQREFTALVRSGQFGD